MCNRARCLACGQPPSTAGTNWHCDYCEGEGRVSLLEIRLVRANGETVVGNINPSLGKTCVWQVLDAYADLLLGVNVRTIHNQSIFGGYLRDDAGDCLTLH